MFYKDTNHPENIEIPQLVGAENHNDPNRPLHLDAEGILQLTANHFVSNRTIILDQTGASKGNAGAIHIEELLLCGLPMTVIDPKGEA